MKLVTYTRAGNQTAGLLLGDQVLDLVAAGKQFGERTDVSSVLGIVQGGAAAIAAVQRIAARCGELAGALHAAKDVKLLAPIPRPARNVFCVGRNYVDHVKEGYAARQQEVKLPVVPQFFTKATHAVNAPEGEVRLDRKVTAKLDYEVELALVIGKGGRDIAKADAFDHVFGYCVANDVSARDLQLSHDQWFKGKSLDTSLPLGPWLATKDEVADVTALELYLTVNGEPRQRAKVAQLIFDIPTIIASLSAGLTLEAGDIIVTGTPSGVGVAMQPPRFLQGGDLVIAGISELGELRNRIVEV